MIRGGRTGLKLDHTLRDELSGENRERPGEIIRSARCSVRAHSYDERESFVQVSEGGREPAFAKATDARN